MPRIDIDPKYRLSVDALDSEHAQLIRIANDLRDAMAQAKADETIRDIVERLVDYAHTHFQHEEQLMADNEFPGLAEHRIKHAELARQVEKYAGELVDHRRKVALQVNLFMNVWLYEHIIQEDALFARYYLERHPRH